ncbi:MAG: cobalamin biosynthesis protein CbiM [Deltaproteobacteria bacterium]|nr:MAG: cobalamin biosynthesis protein CbiM [Deltaproteobacteria bacterium]
MHIAEGVLSPSILGIGGALALFGCSLGLRRLSEDRLMPVALLSAAFFVGSLIHIPIGPASAHLLLNGLLGVLLGWAAFPAILIALLLQVLLFQYGGLTTLGINTVNMALPAVLAGIMTRPWLTNKGWKLVVPAFCCGALGVAGAAFLTALCLALTEEGFLAAAQLLFWAHLPVMFVEGLITAFTVSFLAKTRPELLLFHQD